MQTGETWTLLAVEWGLGEAFDARRVAGIFDRSVHAHEVCPCPVPGVTLLAYRSAIGAAEDGLRVLSEARAKIAMVTGEVDTTQFVGFSPLSGRLYSLLTLVPGDVAVCALSTFESIRHASDQTTAFTDLGPVGLPEIGGRERVFQVSPSGQAVVAISIDPGERAIDTLPAGFGYFVGRRPDLDRCFLYLEQGRNVTITGVSGIGKSHFANRVASEARSSYSSGVAWASLVDSTTIEDAFAAIAKGLGLSIAADATASVRRVLVEEQLLVILDGVDSCGAAVISLLQSEFRGAASRFVVTAVRPLGYSGEEVVALAPMTTPPEDFAPTLDDLYEFEATSLFVDRATDLNEFFVDRMNPEAVAELARRVGGHPRAICMAAAQTRLHSVEMILDALAAMPGRAGYRHAIAASIAGLPESFRHLALALSVCETPVSAFQVARLDENLAADVGALETLVKAGLCEERISPSGRVVYSLFPPVKQHLRKGAAAPRKKLQRLHEELFLGLLTDAVAGHEMTADAGDLDLAEEHASDIFVALGSAARHMSAKSFYDVLRSTAAFFYDHNHINECLEAISTKVAKSGRREDGGVVLLLNMAGTFAAKAGRSKQAHSLYQDALDRVDNGIDIVIKAALVANLANLDWADGRPEVARDRYEFAAELLRHLGRHDLLAKSLISSVTTLIECGDVMSAQEALREALVLAPPATPMDQWCSEIGRGQIEWALGNFVAARDYVARAVQIAQSMNDQLSLLRSLIWLAQILSDAKAAAASTHVLAVAAHNQTEQMYRLHPTNELRVHRVQEQLANQLGEQQYRAEFIAGSVQSLDQVLASIY